jgi:hypothetical protein
MSIPIKPYATSSQVALLVPAVMNSNPDFNDVTTPRKAAVDQYLTWISQQVDLQFQQAGYIVPFVELADETWPEHQNYYLELLTALGAAALTGGHTMKPAPALSPGRGNSTGNIYQDMFNLELRKIWDWSTKMSNIRFRARAYAGTPAEWSITEPIGPSLDYMVSRMAPEDFLMFEDYTILRNNISDYISVYGGLNWLSFHGLVSNRTAGYTYG